MSGIFPFINGDDGIPNDSYTDLPVYKECAWDFVKDEAIFVDGSPKIVYKNEAIKVWIYKAIKTNRYEFDIYSWDYGCEIETLLGKGFNPNFVKSEVARYIQDTLLINPYIVSIKNIDVSFERDILKVYVDLETVYGRLDMYV